MDFLRRLRQTQAKRYGYAAMFVLCVGAFLLYAWPSFGLPKKFTSPDETANYFFSLQVARHGTLRLSDTSMSGAPPLVPRSMTVVNHAIVPGSFFGMPLIYGTLARFVGVSLIPFFTPLASAVAVFLFFLLLQRFFSRRVAFFASVLLVVHPAFWYFSSRGMFHNALFLDLFLCTFLFGMRLRKEAVYPSVFFGFALAATLTVRTSEILWTAPLIIVLLFARRKTLSLRTILIALGTFAVGLVPLLFLNMRLYGNPLASAYTSSLFQESASASSAVAAVQRISAPFGFNLAAVTTNVQRYAGILFSWYTIPLLLGIGVAVLRAFQRRLQQSILLYLVCYLGISVWLFMYYGSWQLQEFADPTKIILGSSYVRYWIPVYVFGLPFCVLGIRAISNRFFRFRFHRFIPVVFLFLLLGLSFHLVLGDELYGVVKLRTDIQQYDQRERAVASHTEENAVVITGYSDKVVFPARRVLVRLPDDKEAMRRSVDALLAGAPVYVYGAEGDVVAQPTIERLRAADYALRPINTFHRDALYRLLPQGSPGAGDVVQ